MQHSHPFVHLSCNGFLHVLDADLAASCMHLHPLMLLLRVVLSRMVRVVAVQGMLDADPSLPAIFSRAKFLVLDEADRLLSATFEGELRTILQVCVCVH